MSSCQAYDDQMSSSGYFLDQQRTENNQILDFLSAVANLDFGAASLAYDELMSTQSEISGSSSSKEFSFLDSQATPQAYSTCMPQSESVDQFCFSSGKQSRVPPAGAERGNCLKVGEEAKEMPCERWFQLPFIEKWLDKSTYFLPLMFTVPVMVLAMSLLIMKTCSKT